MQPSAIHCPTLKTKTQHSIWIINRHQSTVEWFRQHYDIQVGTLDYLDDESMELLNSGDTLLGNLPLQEIAKLCDKGINYYEIRMPITHSPHIRGQELSLEQLKQHPPMLIQYKVQGFGNTFYPPTTEGVPENDY